MATSLRNVDHKVNKSYRHKFQFLLAFELCESKMIRRELKQGGIPLHYLVAFHNNHKSLSTKCVLVVSCRQNTDVMNFGEAKEKGGYQ